MSTPSPFRVARLHLLAAKDWTNIDASVRRFRATFDDLRTEIRKRRNLPHQGMIFQHFFTPVVNSGRRVADWVISTREIPKGKAKAVEMAARAILAPDFTRRSFEVLPWFDKNEARMDLLIEATTWPEKTEAGGQVAPAGSFRVVDSIGSSPKQFEELRALVEEADRKLSGVRDFRKVLYGDVHIVGQISKAHHMAWYYQHDDTVYLRNLAKKGFDDLHALIHELGHRYWFRFASRESKSAVFSIFYRLSGKRLENPLREGDVLPIPVRGLSGPQTIVKDDGVSYHLSGGGSVSVRSIEKILSARQNFPTPYSSTSIEEFFAECFSYYTLGKLKPDLETDFVSALDGVAPSRRGG